MKVVLFLPVILSVTLLVDFTNAFDDYGEYLARSPVFIPPVNPPGSEGMPCSNSTECHKPTGLTCRAGKCGCPEGMTYSSVTRTCDLNFGKPCKLPVLNSDPEETYIGCTVNTFCGPDGKCICNLDFYEDNADCSSKGGYGEACRVNGECLENLDLECRDGRCECSSKLNLINQERSNWCVVKAGAVATGRRPCIRGAAKNQNRVCTCQPEDEYFAGIDGRCHERATQGLNDICSDSRECKWDGTFLSCINGRCTCASGSKFREFLGSESVEAEKNNMQFNMSIKKEFKQCVGLAGSKCNLDEQCVQFATCKSSTCTCDVGYWQTLNGTCGVEHGQLCSASVDCSDSFLCTNGKCACPEPNRQSFNESTGVCHSIVQGSCSENWECVNNAICVNSTIGISRSQCLCKERFVENETGQCDLAFGSECGYGLESTSCDTVAELQCQNLKCTCPDSVNTYFDPNLRQCLVLAGSLCKLDSYNCVANSRCSSKHSKLHGTCNCSKGFKVDAERRCVA